MWFGLLPLPWWGYILVVLGLTHVTIAAVTLYLHRHQAHRALDLHPLVAHFFRFWLWLTTGMVTAEWVAVHRKHHARCETEEDPHSPQVLGLRRVLLEGAELYRGATADPSIVAEFAHGTPDDWVERNVYRRFNFLGVTLMAVIDVALFGALGISIWAVQMLWIPFWAAGVINGVGHALGYRNFEPADASTNLVPWGAVIGGEELHNNHHAFPSSARFALRPWEFDLGWCYIRALQALGLARVKRVAPSARIQDKPEADLETVRSLVRARVHVMAFYARDVLLPTWRAERANADRGCRRLLRRARRALVRDPALVDESAQARLEQALAQSARLETVYRYKLALQQLWVRAPRSHEALLQQLRQWCAEAEATGIQTLEDFARRLRGFTVVQPAAA
ncbi:DesA family fatty acid desaturase [Arhodomonas sp. AD133]|uniref:DesA family fatty acid desaturase n=1 Tax=Arhodomonas sp. AD133 TaxID=3415009 RepID=UPI003EBC9B7A